MAEHEWRGTGFGSAVSCGRCGTVAVDGPAGLEVLPRIRDLYSGKDSGGPVPPCDEAIARAVVGS